MSRTHEPRKPVWVPLVAVGLLAVAVLGGVAWKVAARSRSVSAPPPAATPSVASVAPPAPSARTVTVAANAPGKLYLGGVLVGPLPADVSVEGGAAPRTYTVRAPGFAAQDVLVGGASASRIEVSLEKAELPKLAPAGSHAPPPATAKPTGGGIIVDPWK